jgi:hypothetical protein
MSSSSLRVCDNELPSAVALLDAPQLSSLSLLQAALRVVPRDLDLHDSNVRPLCDLLLDCPPNTPASMLAQLIIDRCRDLSELVTAYRTALSHPPDALDTDAFDGADTF